MANPKKTPWKNIKAAKKIVNLLRKMKRTPRSKKVK